jgi:tRNA modification GTPase
VLSVDTAGIRETTDVVEQIGVKKTFEAVGDADFAMVVVDGSARWTKTIRRR